MIDTPFAVTGRFNEASTPVRVPCCGSVFLDPRKRSRSFFRIRRFQNTFLGIVPATTDATGRYVILRILVKRILRLFDGQ